MALLAFYWSIMIGCYLLASRLRRYAARFAFLDGLLSLSIYLLVFLMGLRMGANREVTSSLGSIGLQALLVTVLTAAGSMLGATLVRRLLHLDAHALALSETEESAEESAEKPAAPADASGAKMSLIIFLMVALGMLCGYFFIPRLFPDVEHFQGISSDWLVAGLCLMLVLVGFSMGLRGAVTQMLRGAGIGVVLVPVFSVVGTLLGGAVYALLSPMSLREGLAISAGFGWYTMAPGVISGAGFAVAGAVSFLHNVLRETLGIILLPLAAKKCGYIEAATLPGTASMDVCLPIVERSCNVATLPYSFTTGMAAALACALLVPLIVSI